MIVIQFMARCDRPLLANSNHALIITSPTPFFYLLTSASSIHSTTFHVSCVDSEWRCGVTDPVNGTGQDAWSHTISRSVGCGWQVFKWLTWTPPAVIIHYHYSWENLQQILRINRNAEKQVKVWQLLIWYFDDGNNGGIFLSIKHLKFNTTLQYYYFQARAMSPCKQVCTFGHLNYDSVKDLSSQQWNSVTGSASRHVITPSPWSWSFSSICNLCASITETFCIHVCDKHILQSISNHLQLMCELEKLCIHTCGNTFSSQYCSFCDHCVRSPPLTHYIVQPCLQ